MTQEKPMPLLTNTDLLENMNVYEKSLEEHTSYDVVTRLNMTTAYGAGARNVRDLYEQARQSDLATIEALTKLAQELVDAVEDSRVELCSAIPHLPKIGVKLATKQEEACRKAIASAALLSIHPNP